VCTVGVSTCEDALKTGEAELLLWKDAEYQTSCRNVRQNDEPSVSMKSFDESLKAKSATAEHESIVQFSQFYGTG
jgi:hypothetical protein